MTSSDSKPELHASSSLDILQRLGVTEAALAKERARADYLASEVERLRAALPASGTADDDADLVAIPRQTLDLLRLKERAIDTVAEGITIADATLPDMPLIYINKAFSKVTGYPLEVVQGRNCRFLQGPGTEPKVVEQLRQAIAAGEPYVSEITNYRRNGDPFINYLSLTPVFSASGDLTHYVGVQSDITELVNQRQSELAARHAAAQAAAATEAKSSFLARMSHEIRTPLNGIISVGQLLADTPLSAQQWDLVNTIRASGEALLTLITDILDFSKIEAGKMELSSVPYCLESTIEAAIEIAGLHAAKKRLHVAYNISPNVPSWIIGDAQRLQQILLNLLNNAIKFTDAGEILLEVWVDDTQGKDDGTASTSTEGAVAHQAASSAIEAESRGSKSIESAVAQRGIVDSTLRGDEADQTASPKPRYCEINFSVRDTGIGIGKDDLARLFRSFSQVDSSPTRRFGGSGLGLTISQKLAEAMGGRMWAESEGPSCGSNFRWCIRAAIIQPPRNTTQRADRRDSSDAVPLRGRKILLVEACPMVRQTMVSALQKWQCTVHAVASEAEAVASLALTPEFAGPALALAVGAAARNALLAKKPPSPADVSLSLRAPCPPRIPDANSYDDGVKSIKTEISAPQGQHTATATGTAVDTAAAACHGPYDVVVMDVGHSTLLHALMDAASPEEARRVVFLGWPGQDDPEEDQDEGQKRHRHVGHKDAHDPGASRGIAGACDDVTPPCHTGDNSLTSSPVYGSGTHATATTWFGSAIRPGIPADAPPPAYSTDALYDLPTKPAAVAPRAVTRPPSQRAQRRRQLGYAVVTRPVRQGRFRLGLEEVLGMDVAIAPGTDANVETTAAGASGRNDAGIDDAVCDSHHPSAATTAHAGKMNQGGVDASGAPRLAQSSFPFATGMESSPRRLTESPSISGSESELSRSKMTSSSAGSLLHAPYRRVPSSASSAMSREEFGTGMIRQRPSSHNLARPDSRLLIAEDNAINMRVALGILRRLGFTDVVTAADGEEAVEAVAAAGGPAAFKAMLIDLHMPRKGGMEAVRDILRRWPGQKTKIIAVTADATCTVYDQCMANGFTGWLAKPFRVEEFAKIMEDDR